MRFYRIWGLTAEEKTKEKYKKLWGKEFYNEIVMLHRADINHNIKGSD